jgi:hypothetical protein
VVAAGGGGTGDGGGCWWHRKIDFEYQDVGNSSLINGGEQITRGQGRRSPLLICGRSGLINFFLFWPVAGPLSYIGQQAYLSLPNFPNIETNKYGRPICCLFPIYN